MQRRVISKAKSIGWMGRVYKNWYLEIEALVDIAVSPI